MFGIGMAEMIFICALALIVVGPDKLPELARSVAKLVLELKKTATGLKENLTEELSPTLDAVRPELEEASKALKENIARQNTPNNPISDTKSDTKTSEKVDKAGEALSTSNNQQETSVTREHNTQEATTPPQPEQQEEAVAQPAPQPAMTTEELIERARKLRDNTHPDKANDA